MSTFCPSGASRRNDAVGVVMLNHFRSSHGRIHFSDAALLQHNLVSVDGSEFFQGVEFLLHSHYNAYFSCCFSLFLRAKLQIILQIVSRNSQNFAIFAPKL